MPTSAKVESLEELRRQIAEARTAVLTDYRGLSVGQLNELRKRLRGAAATYRVIKNRIAKRAVAASPFEGLHDHLKGPTGIVLSAEDPAAVARALQAFARANQRLLIKAGCVDGHVLDADAVRALADLPSRDALRSQLIAAVQGPMTQLCGVLNAPLRELVYILEQRSLSTER